ncbi:hypothetical protein SKTS_17390 [Sulfurimicrobium lacus]|uniref:DUF4395 domain-containing protein n=1 Tax=Sulfurimicrobium lacus TaxID=2715678 RepID=A0A6F8VAI4_9PROT|nr:DUF4395 domain-containing protein [Sulfurimicrobium lacus]BCB26853.1 hypothetical protein SKTS_17390 [Sulfurimicrobium lacus]
MGKIFEFGEALDGYTVPVLNEREVRASAGILFFFALVSFMNAWLVGDFRLTRVFVAAFLIDFTIRIFINPKYAPSLILGRFAVRWQTPEYVGAPQKRFAWSIGWALALTMLYLVVLNRIIGPINLIVCSTCLVLLFFEAAFGICLGCKIYNLFARQQAQHCPGGTCDVRSSLPIGVAQSVVTALFLVALFFLGKTLLNDPRDIRFLEKNATPSTAPTQSGSDSGDCTPPDWAVAMGHAEQWKLHHNCK